jgi:thiol:disulfide interchange protein
MWMVHLKKFMALSLILTVIWLIDVYAALTEASLLIYLHTALCFLFFAFYWRHLLPKKIVLSLGSFLIFAYMTFSLVNRSQEASSISNSAGNINQQMVNLKTGLNWEPWSEERMKELQANKEKVFVEFTAKWCFNCKVNEKLVLHTDAFRELVQEQNITLLLGDWTKRDPVMGKWLQDHGSAGVPAYFVINENGKLIPLGETISIKKIAESFN